MISSGDFFTKQWVLKIKGRYKPIMFNRERKRENTSFFRLFSWAQWRPSLAHTPCPPLFPASGDLVHEKREEARVRAGGK
jgi:hypothetical protein